MQKKFLFSLLLLYPFFSLTAQLQLDHLALSVKDPASSVSFYTEVFGMKEIENRTRKEGIRWISLDGDKELHLISGIPGEIHLNKAVHFAINVTDFTHFIDTLRELEIPFTDWEGNPSSITKRADGIQQVYVRDPDGYWIEVNGAR